MHTIYQLGMTKPQFGFSITPVAYMQARIELVAGSWLKEDMTFYIMKKCRAADNSQAFYAASHIMNEHGEVGHYQACFTKSEREVAPGLKAFAGRHGKWLMLGSGLLMLASCSRLCSAMTPQPTS